MATATATANTNVQRVKAAENPIRKCCLEETERSTVDATKLLYTEFLTDGKAVSIEIVQ